MDGVTAPITVTVEHDLPRADEPWPIEITFTAGGWAPYSPATWDAPAEGGLFEDTEFVSVRLLHAEESDAPELTPDEIAAARVWFESWAASDAVQEAAIRAMAEADPAWRRSNRAVCPWIVGAAS